MQQALQEAGHNPKPLTLLGFHETRIDNPGLQYNNIVLYRDLPGDHHIPSRPLLQGPKMGSSTNQGSLWHPFHEGPTPIFGTKKRTYNLENVFFPFSAPRGDPLK